VPGAAYADASALVKLVLDEAGSAEMRAVATTLDHLVVSEIGDVEVGLTVRRRGGDAAGDTWADVLDRLDLVPLSPTLRRAATDLATTNLRAHDTIHLATALSVAGLTDRFLCYDTRLSTAARAAGLRVESPGEPTG
jgi:predicted nucleic acid-binding protein